MSGSSGDEENVRLFLERILHLQCGVAVLGGAEKFERRAISV